MSAENDYRCGKCFFWNCDKICTCPDSKWFNIERKYHNMCTKYKQEPVIPINENLRRDISSSISAGMSYGKWMAQKAEKQPVKKQTEQEMPWYQKVCEHCGKVFYVETMHKQRFCCKSCRASAYYYERLKKDGKGKNAGNE